MEALVTISLVTIYKWPLKIRVERLAIGFTNLQKNIVSILVKLSISVKP